MDNEVQFEEEETVGQKLKRLIIGNVMIIIIVAFGILWTLRGLLSVKPSGQTIAQILTDSLLGFILSFTLGYMLKFKGIQDGQNDKRFVKKVSEYEGLVQDTRESIDSLDIYCKIKNEERFESKQRWYIKSANLSWEKFNKGDYQNYKTMDCLTRKQKKLVKKACETRVVRLTSALLLSTCKSGDKRHDEVNKMNNTKVGYLGKGVVTKFIFASVSILFAFYSVGDLNLNLGNVIWRLIEFATYTATAMFGYFLSKSYMVDTYSVNVYDSRINFLNDFLISKTKKPELYIQKGDNHNGTVTEQKNADFGRNVPQKSSETANDRRSTNSVFGIADAGRSTDKPL